MHSPWESRTLKKGRDFSQVYIQIYIGTWETHSHVKVGRYLLKLLKGSSNLTILTLQLLSLQSFGLDDGHVRGRSRGSAFEAD